MDRRGDFKKMAERIKGCCPGEGDMVNCCPAMKKMMQNREGEEKRKKKKASGEDTSMLQ